VEAYLFSLHWAVNVVTGVGNSPLIHTTPGELVMAIVLVAAGCVTLARLIGSTISLTKSDDYDLFIHGLHEFDGVLASQGIGPSFRSRCRKYFLNQWQNKAADGAVKTIMQQASPALQSEATVLLNSYWIDQVPFFRDSCSEFCVALVKSTQLVSASKQERLGVPFSMYVVRAGAVLLKNKVLSAGRIWGEDQLLICSLHLLRFDNAVALSYVEVMQLKRSALQAALVPYPEEQHQIRKALVRQVCRAALRVEAQKRLGRFIPDKLVAFLAYNETVEQAASRPDPDPLGPSRGRILSAQDLYPERKEEEEEDLQASAVDSRPSSPRRNRTGGFKLLDRLGVDTGASPAASFLGPAIGTPRGQSTPRGAGPMTPRLRAISGVPTSINSNIVDLGGGSDDPVTRGQMDAALQTASDRLHRHVDTVQRDVQGTARALENVQQEQRQLRGLMDKMFKQMQELCAAQLLHGAPSSRRRHSNPDATPDGCCAPVCDTNIRVNSLWASLADPPTTARLATPGAGGASVESAVPYQFRGGEDV